MYLLLGILVKNLKIDVTLHLISVFSIWFIVEADAEGQKSVLNWFSNFRWVDSKKHNKYYPTLVLFALSYKSFCHFALFFSFYRTHYAFVSFFLDDIGTYVICHMNVIVQGRRSRLKSTSATSRPQSLLESFEANFYSIPSRRGKNTTSAIARWHWLVWHPCDCYFPSCLSCLWIRKIAIVVANDWLSFCEYIQIYSFCYCCYICNYTTL